MEQHMWLELNFYELSQELTKAGKCLNSLKYIHLSHTHPTHTHMHTNTHAHPLTL